ncbi:transmembrane and ubiquitin-like domain-containing protein 1 [Pristis pectinata]|uniref:transmembrane and ubiquitin-like domain-containing protein 1 n=1 Tax=Pristis pectinata TaxID=685728 RepID=UPI00223D380B|nr:transmembrane and ubiquitin-like domain-containing protein 1 [Pristis pectinata]
MALIEGVGDEVTVLFSLVFMMLVLILAWASTRTVDRGDQALRPTGATPVEQQDPVCPSSTEAPPHPAETETGTTAAECTAGRQRDVGEGKRERQRDRAEGDQGRDRAEGERVGVEERQRVGVEERQRVRAEGDQEGDGGEGERQRDGVEGDQEGDSGEEEKQRDGVEGDQEGDGGEGERQRDGVEGDQEGDGGEGERQRDGVEGDQEGDGGEGERQRDGVEGDGVEGERPEKDTEEQVLPEHEETPPTVTATEDLVTDHVPVHPRRRVAAARGGDAAETQSAGDQLPHSDCAQDSSMVMRLKFLNDTERIVQVRPEHTIGHIKRTQFPHQEHQVRLIYQGQLLGDDTQTLSSLHITGNCVVHCHISQNATPQSPAGSHAAENTETTLNVGGLMLPLFFLMLSVLWYYQINYRHFFTAPATISLVGITILFSFVAFGAYRR